MAEDTNDVMKFQLPTDKQILRELRDGRNIGANIAEDLDKHRKTVNPRLRQLEDYGLVQNIGRGVYELTPRGKVALENAEKMNADDVDFEELIARELDEEE